MKELPNPTFALSPIALPRGHFIDTVRQLSKRHRLPNSPMLAEGARRFGQAAWRMKTAQRND